MKAKEAAEVIRAIAGSIRDNPRQFHIDISVIGQQVTSHGGIGLSINAIGGGFGSATVGQIVSLDGAQVRIAQQRGAQAIDQQFEALLKSLDGIAAQLESQMPDKGAASRIYRSLLNTWVPGVITSVVGTLLCQAIGTVI
jgi:hypothetical protein